MTDEETNNEDELTREFAKALFSDNETGTPEPEPTDDDHLAVRLFNSKD